MVKLEAVIQWELLDYHWGDEFALLRLHETWAQLKECPKSSGRAHRAARKLRMEMKRRGLPDPRDLVLRLEPGVPKRAVMAVFRQMLRQEEEAGRMPGELAQWVSTHTRVVLGKAFTFLDYRNGSSVVRNSTFWEVKEEWLKDVEGVERGVGLRRLPGCAKIPV